MRYIELDEVPWKTKQEIALHQLERAIRLLLDENDVISAITLAGASEDILGRLVVQKGDSPSLHRFLDLCSALDKQSTGVSTPRKEFAEIANYFRNELKHFAEGGDVPVLVEAACELLDRAVENWSLLGLIYTPEISRYMTWRLSR